MKVRLKSLLVLAALGPAASPADDWPMHAHDGARSNVTAEALEFPLRAVWRHACVQPPRPAWPEPVKNLNRLDFDYAPQLAVAEGRLIFGSSADDSVRALDAVTGKPLWRFTTGGPVRFGPQIASGRVFFGSDDGRVYCLDAATGRLIWKFHAAPNDEKILGNGRLISRWPIRTGVIVDAAEGVVFATAGMWPSEGIFVYALDAKSGEILWCNDTSGAFPLMGAHQTFSLTGVSPQGNLLLDDESLVVPTGRTCPAVYDRKTGKLRNFSPGFANNGFGGTRLVLDAGKVYGFAKSFYSPLAVRTASLATGDLLEAPRYKPPQHSEFIREKSYSLYEGKTCFLVGEDGNFEAAAAWGLIRAGDALITGEDGRVRATTSDDGESGAWTGEVRGQARELAVADGRLFVATSEGEITCFADGSGRSVPVTETTPARRDESTSGLLEQLTAAEIRQGYVVLAGDFAGWHARAIAANTDLQVIHLAGDPESAETLRKSLLIETAAYGSRIHVVTGAPGALPGFFANAVISTRGDQDAELFRLVRPCGGILIRPRSKHEEEIPEGATVTEAGNLKIFTRGQLPGALDWDSESRFDERVRWPLRPIWFGGPGPAKMNSRKHRLPTLAFAHGRYFVKGENDLLAIDAYNGAELWTAPLEAIQSVNADAEKVYVMIDEGKSCLVLDAATGAELTRYTGNALTGVPESMRTWPRPGVDREVTGSSRIHPFTGQPMPKVWLKAFGCSGMSFSATSVFTRSGSLGTYDFDDDSGMRNFGGLRPSCGQSTIAALGLWIVNEGSSSCECSYGFQTSLALAPAQRRLHEDWAVFYDWNIDSLVRQAHLNLGAPGDRRDDAGDLWVGVPRPEAVDETMLPLTPGGSSWMNIPGVPQQKMPVAIQPPIEITSLEGEDFGPFRVNADRIAIAGTGRPWLYASQIRGIQSATVKLDFLPRLKTLAAAAPPAIDGAGTEAEWGAEPQAFLPDSKTKVFLRHDAEHLYVASVRPTKIGRKGEVEPWRTQMTTDETDVWRADSFEIFLGDGAGEIALQFAVSAGGARLDTRNADKRWNGEWTHAAAASDDTFTTEVAIPWSTLIEAGLDRDSIAINFQINKSHNLGEALLYVGFRGRAHCENFAPLGIGAEPKVPPRQYGLRLHFCELDEKVAPGARVFDVRIQGRTVLSDIDIAATAGHRTADVREIEPVSAGESLVIEFVPKTPGHPPTLSAIELNMP